MLTASTPQPRTVNSAARLSGAEDDFREQVTAMYEVTAGSIGSDLRELEAIATITAQYARDMAVLLGRLEYALREQKYPFVEYLLDTVGEELDHGACSVVRAHVASMGLGR